MDSSPLSPDELFSQVVVEMKRLPVAEVNRNSQELRYSVARAIIQLMWKHRETLEWWYVENEEVTTTIMGRVEWFVSVLVGAHTSLSSYEEPIPLSPNSKRKLGLITLIYSGREWRLAPNNFYISLSVLDKRMDIIEWLIASWDL